MSCFFRTASSKDFLNCLQHRLLLWKQGNINELLGEGHTIQHCLSTAMSGVSRSERLTRSFVSHMLCGNVCAALALLDTMDHPGAPIQLSEPVSPDTPSWTLLDELKQNFLVDNQLVRRHCSLHLQMLLFSSCYI